MARRRQQFGPEPLDMPINAGRQIGRNDAVEVTPVLHIVGGDEQLHNSAVIVAPEIQVEPRV